MTTNQAPEDIATPTLDAVPAALDAAAAATTPAAVDDASAAAIPAVNSSGFYRLRDGRLQFAANAVHAPGYTLTRSTRAATALPRDGWDWFDSSEAAHAHHGLTPPAPAAVEPNNSRSPDRRHRAQRP